MSDRPGWISIDEMYGDLGMTDDQLDAKLDRSLNPRPPGILYDRIGALGLSRGHQVLDIGCRDARHSCELARRFECRVVAVDPVPHQLDRARRLVTERGLADVVRVLHGHIEAIPCDDGSADFVWCRDVLNHVLDLGAALHECARVLKPGGAMLVYQTFATDLLEPKEAERLYASVATVAASMSREHFEGTVQAAGLRVTERDEIGSEWREHAEENGNREGSRQLLHIARMRRDRARLLAEMGPTAFATEFGSCHWGVYQMLGKLCPMVYVLRPEVRTT